MVIWDVRDVISCTLSEPPHDKTNKMACVPSEDSDQPGHPPSLIRVFAVCMKKAWVLSYPLSTQWRLWSDWVDAQADLSLCWVNNHFVGFVMRWLKFCNDFQQNADRSISNNMNWPFHISQKLQHSCHMSCCTTVWQKNESKAEASSFT